MHLKQHLTDTRVHAGGDEGLDLQASARQEMFIVSIASIRSDAANVPERWGGQILHGSPSVNAVPEELPFGQGFVKLTQQELRCVRGEGGDKAREGFVGARVVLGHDGLARGAKSEAEVVDHGDQGATHDAAGGAAIKSDPAGRR